MKSTENRLVKAGLIIIIVYFLCGSIYLWFFGNVNTGKVKSKVTAEEIKAVAETADMEGLDDEGIVETMVFDEDIVINRGTAAKKKTEAVQENHNDNTSNDYIIPDSSTRYLDDSEVSGMSKKNLRLARNEILARHGRIFESEDLNTYFRGKDWYTGTVSPSEFDKNMDSRLSEVELFNIETIKRYE